MVKLMGGWVQATPSNHPKSQSAAADFPQLDADKFFGLLERKLEGVPGGSTDTILGISETAYLIFRSWRELRMVSPEF